jgi:hypothetical protein
MDCSVGVFWNDDGKSKLAQAHPNSLPLSLPLIQCPWGNFPPPVLLAVQGLVTRKVATASLS